MKHTLLTLLAVMGITAGAMAQNQSGYVKYEEVIQFKFDLANDQYGIASKMPKSQTNKMELVFADNKSVYRNQKDQEETENISSIEGDNTFEIKISRPVNEWFIDLDNNQQVFMTSAMGKTYLITEKVEDQEWKVTGETKEILGHVCSKAVRQSGSNELVAWFALDIPVKFGPTGNGQLPGLILELEDVTNNRTTTATEINLTTVDEAEIVAPTKGKKISREKYKKLMEERLREMGDGNNVVIKTITIDN